MDFKYEKSTIVDVSSVPRPSLSNEDLTRIHQPMDRAAEKKLIRKCDWHVLPMISLLYHFAFIDRINIGNARIQGLEDDLKMKGNQYNIALFIFFVPYILLEVPSNIIIKKIAPSTWLSFIMLSWGKPIWVSKQYGGTLLTRSIRYHHYLHGPDAKLRRTVGLQIPFRSL